jgi:NAD-dependent deacetylase
MLNKLYILTGAGISAESGMQTWRDAQGVWDTFEMQDVATPDGWARSPAAVWKFTSRMKAVANAANPNPAHLAVAKSLFALMDRGIDAVLVTQNVDTLHERALEQIGMSSEDCIAMHGRLSASRCTHCQMVWNDPFVHFNTEGKPSGETTGRLCFDDSLPTIQKHIVEPCSHLPLSPCCNALLRPDLVWFGEEPYELNRCYAEVQGTDVFIAIGTSGCVSPACDFVKWAARLNKKARTIFVNINGDDAGQWFNEFRIGNASRMVPQLLEEICGTTLSFQDS